VKRIAIGCDHRGLALKKLVVPLLQNAGHSYQDFNKIKGVMAALCCDVFAAQRARQHNDANVLCLGGENIDTWSALEIVKTFLATGFEGGRHLRRVNKIRSLEGDSQEQ